MTLRQRKSTASPSIGLQDHQAFPIPHPSSQTQHSDSGKKITMTFESTKQDALIVEDDSVTQGCPTGAASASIIAYLKERSPEFQELCRLREIVSAL
jgi:hypothetical protein